MGSESIIVVVVIVVMILAIAFNSIILPKLIDKGNEEDKENKDNK